MVQSEKLHRILYAKSPFTPAQIASMTDAEGWAWVYREGGAKRRARDQASQICFTGFTAAECEALHAKAEATGWLKPVGSVTTQLAFLCRGENAGPAKMEKARRIGAVIIDMDGFGRLIDGGELPASSPAGPTPSEIAG